MRIQQTVSRWSWLLLCALLLTISACNGEEAPPTAETAVPATPDPQTDAGRAFIDSLEVMVLESFPVQVRATVSGSLSDGCTSLAETNVQQQGNIFLIDVTTHYDTQMVCTQALVPFSETVVLDVEGLAAGTYTVRADGISQSFTLEIVNAPPATPDLGSASLTVETDSAQPGEMVTLTGTNFPAGATITIGIGPVASEYDILLNTEAGTDGRFTTAVTVPTYAESGEQWVFVADFNNAKVLADPILIEAANEETSGPPDSEEVNEPEDGLIDQTYMYLIALEDGGQSGPQIGCNDSVVAVLIDIEPTVAPLTAAVNRLLSLNEEFYGQSGLYNTFYQSDLTLQGINIVDREAIIHLAGDLQTGGVCDDPRVLAQLRYTALQYPTVDSVCILLNGQSLPTQVSEQS